MGTPVISTNADKEWYVIAARGEAPIIVQGRRKAWDTFRTEVGMLPEGIQGVARDHLEDPAPTPPGFVAQGTNARSVFVSMYAARSLVV